MATPSTPTAQIMISRRDIRGASGAYAKAPTIPPIANAINTALGKVAFTAALAGGSAWLHGHILKELA